VSELTAQVVVVAKENLASTVESVVSLIAATPGLSLIAIDNASENPDILKFFKGVAEVVVRNNKQVSLAQAWNQGVYLSTAPVVVITNNDILYAPGWLPPIIEGLKDDTIGVLQSHNTLSTLPVGFPANYKTENRIDEIPTNDFKGCCFGFRREVYDIVEHQQGLRAGQSVGGFDSRYYPFGAEDQDFYLMVRKCGFKTLTHFGSYVHHWTGKTMDAIYTREEFEGHKQRANIMFHKKWGETNAAV
jgi:GT2 family glycosyltransferase